VISAKKEFHCEVFTPCIVKIQLPLKEAWWIISEVALDWWHTITIGGSFSQCMYKLCGLRGEGTKAMKLSNITQ